VGQVRQLQQLLFQRRLGGRQLAVQRLDLRLQRGAGRLGGLAGLARRRLSDLLRDAVLLGLQALRLVLQVAHAAVQRQHAVEVDDGAQAIEPCPHFFGLLSDQADVQHGDGV